MAEPDDPVRVCDPDVPIELYDLDVDPAEQADVAGQHPDVVKRVRSVMESRTESHVPRWNFARR